MLHSPQDLDLRVLACWQKRLLWMPSVSVASNLWCLGLPVPSNGFLPVPDGYQIMMLASISVGIILLCRTLGINTFGTIALGMIGLAPIMNLIVVLILHAMVTDRFRQAGINVSILGARADDVERAANPWLCRSCKYDLRGNESGICPECGSAVPEGTTTIGGLENR